MATPARLPDNGPRSALFDDHVAAAHVPGSLHLAPDSAIQRLVERQGYIPLIRQLAEDLAHRDRELVQCRRRADERERALKRMLVDVEVSHADIERRLTAATAPAPALRRRPSRETVHSDATGYTESIDELVLQALGDEGSFSAAGRDDAASGCSALLTNDSDDCADDDADDDRGTSDELLATPRPAAASRPLGRTDDADDDAGSVRSSASRRSSTLRGWKGLFVGRGVAGDAGGGSGGGSDEEARRPSRPGRHRQSAAVAVAGGAFSTPRNKPLPPGTFGPPLPLPTETPPAASPSPMVRSESRASLASGRSVSGRLHRKSPQPAAQAAATYTQNHLAADQSPAGPPQAAAPPTPTPPPAEPTQSGSLAQRRTSGSVAHWALRVVSQAPPATDEQESIAPSTPRSVASFDAAAAAAGAGAGAGTGDTRKRRPSLSMGDSLQRSKARTAAAAQAARSRAPSVSSPNNNSNNNSQPAGAAAAAATSAAAAAATTTATATATTTAKTTSSFFQDIRGTAERIVPLGSGLQHHAGAKKAGSDDAGPVEMDMIIPPEAQPPTLLLQGWNQQYPNDFLTDRFGFIYNKQHRCVAVKGVDSIEGSYTERKHSGDVVKTANPAATPAAATAAAAAATTATAAAASAAPAAPAAPAPVDDATGSSPKSAVSVPDYPDPANWPETIYGPTSLASMSLPPAITQLCTASASSSASSLASSPSPSSPSPSSAAEEAAVRLLLKQMADRHDALQRDRSLKWNEFLRKVRIERRRINAAAAAAEDGGEKDTMPETLMADGEVIGVSTLGTEGRGGKLRWKEFKALVLGGIPVTYRWKIWTECSAATSMKVPGYYDDLLQHTADDPAVMSQIAMDINRTLTDNVFFRKGPGVAKLKQVLMAYSRRNPEVGYCQGMNMIAASLLLIMPSEEDAFWVLCSIVERIMPKTYFEPNLLASRADQEARSPPPCPVPVPYPVPCVLRRKREKTKTKTKNKKRKIKEK